MLEDLVKQSCGDVPAMDGYGFGLVTFFQDVVTSLYSVNDPAVLQEPSKQFLIFYSHSVSPFCKNYTYLSRGNKKARTQEGRGKWDNANTNKPI